MYILVYSKYVLVSLYLWLKVRTWGSFYSTIRRSFMSSEKGKVVDLALAAVVKNAKIITISKQFLVELISNIKEIAALKGIKGGLTLERLKKAISKMNLTVKEVKDCGLKHMRSMAWEVNKQSFT